MWDVNRVSSYPHSYFNTTIFEKPTDSPTYMHKRSYHNSHVFISVPKSQFECAMIICSNHDDQLEAISCDHSKEEFDIAKTKALLLNRNIFLEVDNPTKPNVSLDLTYITSPTSTTLQFRIDMGTTRFF